jgi:ureidoglycolate dehydrogenase (NAD+)
MNEQSVRIGKQELTAFAADIFLAAGLERAIAAPWAASLVWANLRGVDSHGVIRIPRYVELIASGGINPRPDLRVEKSDGAIALIDCDRAPGPYAMMRAMDEAIARARSVHIGWCAARNITHAGAIGYFALQAAEAGMIGLVMTASGPMMAYHGGRTPAVSTNPLAIAVPTGQRRPYVLDMSTALVPNGKVMDARDRGVAVPVGWGLDAEGRDTTNPGKIATLLPFAGPKGAGLSFMIECLASLLVANPRIAPALAGTKSSGGPRLNGVAMAIDVGAFRDLGGFAADADLLGDAIAGLPPAEGVERILLPGERGDGVLADREVEGIPVPPGTWSRLLGAAQKLGVGAPATTPRA